MQISQNTFQLHMPSTVSLLFPLIFSLQCFPHSGTTFPTHAKHSLSLFFLSFSCFLSFLPLFYLPYFPILSGIFFLFAFPASNGSSLVFPRTGDWHGSRRGPQLLSSSPPLSIKTQSSHLIIVRSKIEAGGCRGNLSLSGQTYDPVQIGFSLMMQCKQGKTTPWSRKPKRSQCRQDTVWATLWSPWPFIYYLLIFESNAVQKRDWNNTQEIK